MNMNFLAVLTTSPAIYNGWSTWKTSGEYNFTPVNMTSFGRRNVRKHREIKNGKKCIILENYSKIDCMEKREITSSE